MITTQLELLDVQEETFEAGTILIEENSPGTNTFVLSTGEVSISINGKEIALVSENGTIFGEMSALLGKSRGATVTASTDCKLYVLDDLLTFLRKNPELAILLLKIMARRVDASNVQLTEKKWWQIF
ncbi:MAG: cyclic nucleotide-binding domain-containing protein [Lentisphaeria bacterium]|nr:cyclic nucleotide-binding domain-containing protein [Lentisphaeria bacterium]NQZ70302.1 cyclic nucleotide-binding domain-containing protein [Lentisphaeria bacterium]